MVVESGRRDKEPETNHRKDGVDGREVEEERDDNAGERARQVVGQGDGRAQEEHRGEKIDGGERFDNNEFERDESPQRNARER